MLKLPTKNPKKSGIHLNLKLKRQTHPWDMAAEKARAKHLKETPKTHEVAKHFRKKLFNFNEGPSGQLSQILITPQETITEQEIETNLPLFDEPEDCAEGFFLCPNCTCWFTNKKDLNFHQKKWCDR